MNPLVVTRANAIGNTDQRTAVGISVLSLVAHSKYADTAAEVEKLSLAPLVERVSNRFPLTVAQLAQADELIHGLLNQALQIAGGQVE